MERLGQATVQAPPAKRRWAVGFALAANGLATTLPLITLGVLLPSITQSFGLTDSQAGLLGGVTTAGFLLVTIPAAMFLTRADPYLLTAASIGSGAVFTLLHGAAGSFALLLLARLGFSLSFALRPASQAMVIQRWFPVREVPLVQGVILAVLGTAEFVALYFTPVLLEGTGNWRTVYFIYGVLSLGVAGVWLLAGRGGGSAFGVWFGGRRGSLGPAAEMPQILGRGAIASRSLPKTDLDDGGSLRTALRHREVWLVGIATLTSGFSWWAYLTFWPTFMLESRDVPLATSGLLFGILSLATVPASLFFGYLGTRIRSRRMILVGAALAIGVSGIGLLVTSELWLLVTMCVVAGAAWGYVPIAFAIPYELRGIRPREVALSAAVINTFLMSGGVIGPSLVGLLSDLSGSLYAALMVSAIIPFSMAFIALGIRDHQGAP